MQQHEEYLHFLTKPNRERRITLMRGVELNNWYDPKEFPYLLDTKDHMHPAVDLDHAIELAKGYNISDLRAVRKHCPITNRWEEVEFSEDGDTIIEYMEVNYATTTSNI